MIVKLMGPENLGDAHKAKSFRLFGDVKRVDFYRNVDTNKHNSYLEFRDGSTWTAELDGNAYVMDESGKTIDSFWCSLPELTATATGSGQTPNG